MISCDFGMLRHENVFTFLYFSFVFSQFLVLIFLYRLLFCGNDYTQEALSHEALKYYKYWHWVVNYF